MEEDLISFFSTHKMLHCAVESLVLGPDFTELLSNSSSPPTLPPQTALEIWRDGAPRNEREETEGGVGVCRANIHQEEGDTSPHLLHWDSILAPGRISG